MVGAQENFSSLCSVTNLRVKSSFWRKFCTEIVTAGWAQWCVLLVPVGSDIFVKKRVQIMLLQEL